MNTLNTEYPCDKYYVAQPEGGVIASDNYPFNYHDNSECRNKIYTSHLYPETKVKLCFQFFRFQAELLVYRSPDYLTLNGQIYGGRGRSLNGISIWEDPLCTGM